MDYAWRNVNLIIRFRFEGFPAVSLKSQAFWICSQYDPTKRQWLFTIRHGLTSYKTWILFITRL